jgi:hypothetical protein
VTIVPESPPRLIKRFAEFELKERIDLVPRGRRGLYVVYCLKNVDGKDHFDVVYVGMTTGGMRVHLFRTKVQRLTLLPRRPIPNPARVFHALHGIRPGNKLGRLGVMKRAARGGGHGSSWLQFLGIPIPRHFDH